MAPQIHRVVLFFLPNLATFNIFVPVLSLNVWHLNVHSNANVQCLSHSNTIHKDSHSHAVKATKTEEYFSSVSVALICVSLKRL